MAADQRQHSEAGERVQLHAAPALPHESKA